MGDIFSTFDIVIFLGSLAAVMAVGLYAGRREETSQDYFLAGRSIPWWGVAGSIFGSNVSANHIVGMLGIGFSIGFAQSHFELGAILGLMLLCYGFLPVYRKLQVYTLSEYLSRRYNESARLIYAVVMVVIMAGVQLVPAFYIGGRSLCEMIGDQAFEQAAPDEGADPAEGARDEPAGAKRYAVTVKWHYYALSILALAAVTGSYTVLGGMKAVIWTDVIQSVLLLLAAVVVALLTFAQPEVGGWTGMLAKDQAGDRQLMRLYLPSDHQQLPWTGVLTGLMVLHCFYWGTNQFIVQRALGARSDHDARLGIVVAGFLKLLIPFVSIGAGVAAYYLFTARLERVVDADAAFPVLVKEVVAPIGYGVVGLIAAGLIGAILSTIDSMMNSAATIVTFDIYKRYINPEASERQLIWVGRVAIVLFLVVAALLAVFAVDRNSKGNFFLSIARYQSYLTPGLLAAFFLGMFWRRATGAGAVAAIIAGPLFSFSFAPLYARWAAAGADGSIPAIAGLFGSQLNFLHLVALSFAVALLVHVAVSLMTTADEKKQQYTWTGLGGHNPDAVRALVAKFIASVAFYLLLAALWHYSSWFKATWQPALIGACWTMGMFVRGAVKARQRETATSRLGADDRIWAGVLCSAAIFFLLYYL